MLFTWHVSQILIEIHKTKLNYINEYVIFYSNEELIKIIQIKTKFYFLGY